MQVKSKSVLSAKSGQRKQLRLNKASKINIALRLLKGFSLFIVLFIVTIFIYFFIFLKKDSVFNNANFVRSKFTQILEKPLPTPLITPPPPTSSPTPKPLSFDEMNVLYGPCVRLPTLMYHHIQSKETAITNKQTGLTVYTDVFKAQMEYLKSKGYNTVTMNDLINFFDSGVSIPPKSILLTFDDGYSDFFSDAYPILSSLNYRATVFIPTGLMQNQGYLTWEEIFGMSQGVLFANHTWSHKNMTTQEKIVNTEILTAETQLTEKGLNNPKTFAYPYGSRNITAENYLNSLNYKLAFTTRPGNVLCSKQRLNLPRVRIGNNPLSYYGF